MATLEPSLLSVAGRRSAGGYRCFMEQDEVPTGRITAHAVIEPELRSQLEAVARENDRSLAAEVRVAIREHVQRETPATPERTEA
jgi:hypothetical protein